MPSGDGGINGRYQRGWDAAYLASVLRMWESPEADVEAAQTIIEEFGSLSAVLSAPAYELMANTRIGASGTRNINFARISLQESSYRDLQDSPFLTSSDKLIRYLTIQAGNKPVEEVRLLSFGVKMNLLSDVCICQGTSTHVSVDARTIIGAALRAGACSIVLSHNHPSGDPEPSHDDKVLTSQLADACRLVDINFHDHIIVAKSRWYSFKQAGLV